MEKIGHRNEQYFFLVNTNMLVRNNQTEKTLERKDARRTKGLNKKNNKNKSNGVTLTRVLQKTRGAENGYLLSCHG